MKTTYSNKLVIFGLITALMATTPVKAHGPGGPVINQVSGIQAPGHIPGGPAIVVINHQPVAPQPSKLRVIFTAAKELGSATVEIGHATYEATCATVRFCHKAAVLTYVAAKRTYQATKWATTCIYNWATNDDQRQVQASLAVAPNNFVNQNNNHQNQPAFNPAWQR